MRKNKLLLLLVLLMTAATGARAAWTGGTYTATANENLGAITVNGDATLTINSDVTVTVTGGINVASGTLTVTGPGTLVVNGAKGNDGNSDFDGGPGGTGGVAISGNIIVQGGATVTATGGTGGTGGNGEWDGGTGGNGGVAFAGTLTYKSGTVTANGGSAGSGGWSDDEERYASSGSAGKAFANDVDFTQTTGYSVTNGTSTIGSVLNQTKVVISGGTEPAAAATYTVSLKDGVKDADKWTISPNPAEEGQTVTLQYNGRLKVKGVKATSDAAPAVTWNTVDLSTLTADYEAQDGDVLTGTLGANVKISIADGATVTLDGVTINGVNNSNYEWAGITCLGDATIILSGTNTVKGFYQNYPGIQAAAAGKTLIINGTGSLTASSYGKGAGIGGVNNVACGNIEIQGGTITATSVTYGAGIGGGDRADCGNITISGGTVNATGGERGAGIGGGRRGPDNGSCGNILISGGTVTATGGINAAGIGGGRGYNDGTFSSCGTITITSGVTKVTATMGDGAPYSIGAGKYGNCGTVTIGGVEGAITDSPYTYDPTAQAKPAATVTTAPTGAAIVGVGKTTALVSGGVADGGTLMYAVTTTNTKPTSTAGFSDAVPTAETITASGKVYVWYYVKADDTHSDSEIAGPVSVTLVEEITWDVTNISDLRVVGTFQSYAKDGVTLSANSDMNQARWRDKGDPTRAGIQFEAMESGGFTFTAPTGKKFTKIEMTLTGSAGWDIANLGDWALNNSTVTWKGTAAASKVELLTGADMFYGAPVKYIAFYLSE